MFGNFIYFIIALLIYATYQPSDQTTFSLLDTLIFAVSLAVLFFIFSRRQFNRIVNKALDSNHTELDQKFTATLTRQSIMAIALFAVDIYALNLPSFFSGLTLFETLPTLEALLFLCLFVAYLSMVWANAHDAYRLIYHSRIDRKNYVLSNIAFSIPVLLPWLLLSGIADMIMALPFDRPREILASPAGEIGYFFIFLFVAAVMAPLIVQKFWRCRPLESGSYRERIESICHRAQLKFADILRWPLFEGRMITAGVMGLVSRFRYILVTDALLHLLTPEEIDAVIAHEIGHVKRRHLLFYLFFLIGFSVIAFSTYSILGYIIILSDTLYRVIFMIGIDLVSFITGARSVAIILIFLLYFRYVFGYFMRNFERQADAYVYNLFDSALPLISTFQKIVAASGHPAEKPNWHHFSIRQRIDFLVRCETDSSWIQRHDRKVRSSIAIWASAMIILGAAGYQLNFGQVGERLNDKVLEAAITKAITIGGEEDTASLYLMLGDLNFSRNRFGKAASAYRSAIELEPDNAIALNNYAWLLATSEDHALRDPHQALALAKRAVAIEPSPHALDTLAESLYLNGQIDAAIETAETALSKAKANRAYYDGQLEKFRAARETPTDD